MKTRYVIIGNATAAVAAVEAIRSLDSSGELTVISKEPHHTYGRPLISYLLCGKTTRGLMKYRPDDFYVRNNCRFMGGWCAEKIDSKKKTVTAVDAGGKSETLSYDKLLVATGSSPFVPPMDGLDLVSDRHFFMTLDDADNLEKSLRPDARVLIVGAGLIGLKCAEGIYGRCKSITVIDLAPQILSSILDERTAAVVRQHLERQRITFCLGKSAEHFEKTDNGYRAVLSGGGSVDFDILVLAVGVRANVQLVKDGGGTVNRGIVVNEKMETSLPDVYAAGDCSEGFDASIGANRILALLPNAYMQGECAGKNMAGTEATYTDAIPLNAIGFFGMHIMTAGTYTGTVYQESDCANMKYKTLFYEDNVLKGFIMINNESKAGIYTAMIRNKTKLSDVDFAQICKDPGLIAFSKTVRDSILTPVCS